MVQQCAGCELPIADKFLLKVLDRVWHVNCVQCCECKCTLTEKCFSREGRLFCRKDFYRRYGTKCAGCTQGISPNDMVRRARNLVFHVDCFICSVCKRQIATGDELYYIGGCNFICKEDFYHAGKITQTESEKDLGFGLDDDLEAALGGKRRGPRTTIKAKQLEALKSTFAATPKPTRNIREKLAQETGLNMRVIQVWFQNRRSKERRLKQQGSSQQSTSQNRSRSHRRTRSARLDSRDSLEENQSINTPHLQDYQPQDIPTHVPPSPSPQYLSIPVSQYNNGYFSKSDAVSEVITSMNATEMPPSGYTARPLGVTQLHSNGSPGSTLSSSEHFSHHTNSNAGTGQPQNTLISPPPTEVW